MENEQLEQLGRFADVVVDKAMAVAKEIVARNPPFNNVYGDFSELKPLARGIVYALFDALANGPPPGFQEYVDSGQPEQSESRPEQARPEQARPEQNGSRPEQAPEQSKS